MDKLYFCVIESSGFLQRIIKVLTRSRVNHSFLVFLSTDFNTYWVMEAGKDGVLAAPYRLTGEKITVFSHDKATTAILPSLSTYVGMGYDYMGLFGFVLSLILLRGFKRKIKNIFHGKRVMFCSEFTATVMRRCGIKAFKDIDPSLTSPGDLLRIMQGKDSGFVQVTEVPWRGFR